MSPVLAGTVTFWCYYTSTIGPRCPAPPAPPRRSDAAPTTRSMSYHPNRRCTRRYCRQSHDRCRSPGATDCLRKLGDLLRAYPSIGASLLFRFRKISRSVVERPDPEGSGDWRSAATSYRSTGKARAEATTAGTPSVSTRRKGGHSVAGGGAKRGSSSDPLRPQKGGHPEPERGSLRALQEEPYEPVRNRDTACGRDTDSNQEEDAGLEGPLLPTRVSPGARCVSVGKVPDRPGCPSRQSTRGATSEKAPTRKRLPWHGSPLPNPQPHRDR